MTDIWITPDMVFDGQDLQTGQSLRITDNTIAEIAPARADAGGARRGPAVAAAAAAAAHAVAARVQVVGLVPRGGGGAQPEAGGGRAVGGDGGAGAGVAALGGAAGGPAAAAAAAVRARRAAIGRSVVRVVADPESRIPVAILIEVPERWKSNVMCCLMLTVPSLTVPNKGEIGTQRRYYRYTVPAVLVAH